MSTGLGVVLGFVALLLLVMSIAAFSDHVGPHIGTGVATLGGGGALMYAGYRVLTQGEVT